MRFNKLDLNLLVALNALLTERNTSRAGERIHLSQPAMSNALARLREYFEDDLLVQQGRQFILTPRAESLVEPVREVLMSIESTIATKPVFEPSTASKVFSVVLSDFTMTVFVPELVRHLYAAAPGVRLDLRMLNDTPLAQLEDSGADLLIIPSQYVSDEHPSSPLFRESYLCVTWEGNQYVKDELTFENYLVCGHVVAQYAAGFKAPAFDSWFLDRFGVKRRVEITAPSLAALPSLVVGTDRIATVHRRLAERARAFLPIKIWEAPLEIPILEQTMQWHRHRSNDPGLKWLRDQAILVGARI